MSARTETLNAITMAVARHRRETLDRVQGSADRLRALLAGGSRD